MNTWFLFLFSLNRGISENTSHFPHLTKVFLKNIFKMIYFLCDWITRFEVLLLVLIFQYIQNKITKVEFFTIHIKFG